MLSEHGTAKRKMNSRGRTRSGERSRGQTTGISRDAQPRLNPNGSVDDPDHLDIVPIEIHSYIFVHLNFEAFLIRASTTGAY